MRFLILIPALVLCFAGVANISAQDPVSPPQFQAEPAITLTRDLLSKEGIGVSGASKTIEAFFRSHPSFSLEDLQALELTTADGRKVALSKVARISVQFKKRLEAGK